MGQRAVSPEHEAMFSAEDLLSYKRQFAAFDVDGGGSVDEHELGTMLAKMGAEVPTAQLKELIAEVDAFDVRLRLLERLQHVLHLVRVLLELHESLLRRVMKMSQLFRGTYEDLTSEADENVRDLTSELV